MDQLETLPRPRRRRVAASLIFVMVLFGVLFAFMDARQAWQVVQHARWQMLPAAVLFTAISYFCLSAGYAVLNRLFRLRVPGRDLLEIGFVSFALNNLVSIGGLAGYSLRPSGCPHSKWRKPAGSSAIMTM